MLRILLASLMFSCAAPALAEAGAAANSPTILVFGDSLSAGHGLANGQAWPSLLTQRLQAGKSPYSVVNASISGETSAGGRTRLPAALERTRPAVVVIALGANDGLRGLPVKQLRENLVAMARACKAQKARVLLVGMRLPPNYGAAYTEEFDHAFAMVAKQEKLPLLPFLLEPVASDRANFQPDGLHPVAAAQPKILDHVWPALKPLLKQR
ncbi:arylesterase [Sulfurisoma sediminicola]|uniref:Acyl-CoA thioesterase-1 n=1 Tax=Sulfurisoma sediminicola TaxID=1381557 RepID=A0A497XF79_9PROT|nr:arylesterase [Sulfurisoma sediminicola]RLJ65374.1 acyl-CoA thioesterase-1 [Sulfurisoma sediminicola]